VENKQVSQEQAHTIDQAMSITELTEEELGYFKMRGGITQALGSPVPPTIHTGSVQVSEGEYILLCSDGIHDNLSDREIQSLLGTHPSYGSAKKLVQYALNRSQEDFDNTIRAKPDDMTALLISIR
jgi:protein phosphatase